MASIGQGKNIVIYNESLSEPPDRAYSEKILFSTGRAIRLAPVALYPSRSLAFYKVLSIINPQN